MAAEDIIRALNARVAKGATVKVRLSHEGRVQKYTAVVQDDHRFTHSYADEPSEALRLALKRADRADGKSA